MNKQSNNEREFKVVCITCGGKIRENASADAYGMCLGCFYAMLAARLRSRKRIATGEFVSDR
jgi:hypothetical protein